MDDSQEESLLPPPRQIPLEHKGASTITVGTITGFSNLSRPPEIEGRPRSRDGTVMPCGLKCTANCRNSSRPFCATLTERQKEVLIVSPGLMVKEALQLRDEWCAGKTKALSSEQVSHQETRTRLTHEIEAHGVTRNSLETCQHNLADASELVSSTGIELEHKKQQIRHLLVGLALISLTCLGLAAALIWSRR